MKLSPMFGGASVAVRAAQPKSRLWKSAQIWNRPSDICESHSKLVPFGVTPYASTRTMPKSVESRFGGWGISTATPKELLFGLGKKRTIYTEGCS
ncbi:hypothetical protein GCG54_00009268 [Colletotrichum gloeosporioides]|uniref:Uncharacterized protein n=1 Tax=Colletotrichum gloeosporioides TaxID=474922 RepID=A0A8H4FBV3_COLGL|nr:uncharacterized protein GCG54_00009268 [Colletotrichum gloeosporioides]KAF3797297.1 hypothetical protein GCG54_00009268 [Colletotrichum gloeosporioides]